MLTLTQIGAIIRRTFCDGPGSTLLQKQKFRFLLSTTTILKISS